MKVIAIIPARYGSTRFPGKPLAMLKGKPLLQWVVEGTKTSSLLEEIYVATDDIRIQELCKKINIDCLMTPTSCATGTDRLFEATKGLEFDVAVNIQGDEPLINSEYIDPLVNAFKKNPALDMATLAHPLAAHDVENQNAVKVVMNHQDEAIYFSRFGIPFSREKFELNGPAMKHIGLYAYSKEFLRQFCTSPQSAIEKAESLEQLRALYLGAKIKVLRVGKPTYGVDTPEDLQKLEASLK